MDPSLKFFAVEFPFFEGALEDPSILRALDRLLKWRVPMRSEVIFWEAVVSNQSAVKASKPLSLCGFRSMEVSEVE